MIFFSNPLYLIGLAFISIPVILHLFNLQKANKVKFSSLLFVKQVKESDIKRLKLKDLLLLIIRILYITFIVLAFSGLHIKSRLNFIGNEKNKTAIIIDDSYSLDFNNLITKQFQISNDILSKYSGNNEFRIYKSSQIITDDFADRNIDTLKPSLLRADVSNIFARIVENYDNIILFTDKQASNYIDKIIPNDKLINSDIIIYDVSEGPVNNIGIESINNISDIPDKSAVQKIKIKIKNFNNFDTPDLSLKIYLNDIEAGEIRVSLTANEEKELFYDVSPQSEDYINLKIILYCDDKINYLKEDDYAYYSINFGRENNIGIIGGDNSDIKYILASFNSFQDNGNIIRIKTLNKFSEINNYDAIIIYNDFSLSEDNMRELISYSNTGKGIFLFLTLKSDIKNLNKFFKDYANSIMISRLEKMDTTDLQTTIDINHPIYNGIFQNDKTEFYFGNIKNIYSVVMNNSSAAIMTLKNSYPIIIETNTNAGKLLISTLSPDEKMSSFAQSDIFAPLINRSIYYLISRDNYSKYNVIGKNNFITLYNKSNTVKIKNPIGDEEILNTSSDKNEKIINIPLRKFYLNNGIYAISDSLQNVRQYFSLNTDIVEGSTAKISDEDIKKYFSEGSFGKVSIVNKTARIGEILNEKKNGTDLSSIFLILGIIFLILEIIYNLNFNKFKGK